MFNNCNYLRIWAWKSPIRWRLTITQLDSQEFLSSFFALWKFPIALGRWKISILRISRYWRSDYRFFGVGTYATFYWPICNAMHRYFYLKFLVKNTWMRSVLATKKKTATNYHSVKDVLVLLTWKSSKNEGFWYVAFFYPEKMSLIVKRGG